MLRTEKVYHFRDIVVLPCVFGGEQVGVYIVAYLWTQSHERKILIRGIRHPDRASLVFSFSHHLCFSFFETIFGIHALGKWLLESSNQGRCCKRCHWQKGARLSKRSRTTPVYLYAVVRVAKDLRKRRVWRDTQSEGGVEFGVTVRHHDSLAHFSAAD